MPPRTLADFPLPQRRAAAWWVGLFGLPFVAFACWHVLFGIWPDVSDWARMSRWQPGEATVLAAELKLRHGSRGGASSEATATYRYTVGGQEYTGQRVGIPRGSDNVGRYQADMAHALQARLQRGEPVRIWVNPANPQEAVVYRELHGKLLAVRVALALVFGSVGLGLVAAALWLRRANPAEAHGGSKKSQGGAPGLPRKYGNVWLHQAPGGVRLRLPYGRDLMRHIGSIVGGAVFFGMALAIWSFLVGRDDVVPVIFALVFGLLGVAFSASSLFCLTTSLQAELDERGIRVRRRFLGLPLHSHQVPPESVKRLELKYEQTIEHKGREIAWYRLLAQLKNGGHIALTDSLEGEAAARGLFGQVVELSGYKG